MIPNGIDGNAGIIPARAGFTLALRTGDYRDLDHPRSRGVYAQQPRGEDHIRGSSPLARGLPSVNGAEDCAWGIIPARAGFTRALDKTVLVLPDHPRSRGVYSSRSTP